MSAGVTIMPTILLVEDSPTQSLQMRMLLESGSHVVRCAGDGTEAIQQLSNGFCELVVTDLEMPVMDGLQLVTRMRCDFPHIPAVLVTGRGSERLAAEALRRGAAGYVPKAMVDELLLPTVDDVLGLIRTEPSYARLISHMTENRFVFEMPNDDRLFMPAIDLVLQVARGIDLVKEQEHARVATALKHALDNALYRGNLELNDQQWRCVSSEVREVNTSQPVTVAHRLNSEPFRSRAIHFDARIMRDMLRVVIRDQGPGFDVKRISVPTGQSSLSDNSGRGLVLIQSFMDKVAFNEQGNEITMIKYREKSQAQKAIA
jgi:CheY-like chemotaxis protein